MFIGLQTPKLEFVRVLKANSQQLTFYVTFEAKDLSSGDVATYQTVVLYYPSGGKYPPSEFTFIRLEPEHNKIKRLETEHRKINGKIV